LRTPARFAHSLSVNPSERAWRASATTTWGRDPVDFFINQRMSLVDFKVNWAHSRLFRGDFVNYIGRAEGRDATRQDNDAPI
jgi:hypothetical protein